jgi:hypothetical protein
MPAVTMTTNFLIVALEVKRPETEQDRKGKKLHQIKKESKKGKERRGKAQQKKGREQQKKTHKGKRKKLFSLISLSLSLSLSREKGAPLFDKIH